MCAYTHTHTHKQMIPIESFECQSMTGNFVPIVPGGSNIKLTYQNRKEYVEKALNFRLHELDHQVHTKASRHTLGTSQCQCQTQH